MPSCNEKREKIRQREQTGKKNYEGIKYSSRKNKTNIIIIIIIPTVNISRFVLHVN